jgi:hypothetical protein
MAHFEQPPVPLNSGVISYEEYMDLEIRYDLLVRAVDDARRALSSAPSMDMDSAPSEVRASVLASEHASIILVAARETINKLGHHEIR